MKTFTKRDFPVENVRRFLEPGPVVLVSSAHRGEQDIMTMGWHMVLDPPLVGCYVWDKNHSHSLIRRSKEAVINVPTADMIKTVIGIGNTHGGEVGQVRHVRADRGEGFERSARR